MRVPLAYIFGSVAVLLILLIMPHYRDQLPFPQIVEAIPEIRSLAYVAFTVGLVSLVAEHHLESVERRFQDKIEPLLQRLSGDLRGGIEQGLASTNITLQGGLRDVAAALAKEVRGASEGILKEFSNSQLVNKLIDAIYSPELRSLAKQDRVQEAIARLAPSQAPDIAELRQKISLLVISQEEKNWREAIELLDKNKPAQKPDYYLSLAFRFWSVGKLEDAIALAEQGMAITADPIPLAKFQNSLAYYYADAGRIDKRDVAFQYAQAALQARSAESGPLDTLGFLKITFGTTEKEVMEGVEGVELCTQAWKKGGRFELYSKHIQKAATRIEEIRRTAPLQKPKQSASDTNLTE